MMSDLHKDTVLIVDDDEFVIESLRICLEDDYIVESATTLSQASKIINRVDVSLVLLDLTVGSADGKDFLLEIRANGFKEPVVILSGDTTRTVELWLSGANVSLIKPIEIVDVLPVVSKAIDEASMRRGKYELSEVASQMIEDLHLRLPHALDRAGKLLDLVDAASERVGISTVVKNAQGRATIQEASRIVKSTSEKISLAYRAITMVAILALSAVIWNQYDNNRVMKDAIAKLEKSIEPDKFKSVVDDLEWR